MTVASKCEKLLAEDNGADPLQGLKLPAELVVQSRDVSPGLAELYQRIEYQKMMDQDPLIKKLEESKRKTAEAFQSAADSLKNAKDAFTQAGSAEKAADAEAKDATAKPDPPASGA